jgi:hypothetical protein
MENYRNKQFVVWTTHHSVVCDKIPCLPLHVTREVNHSFFALYPLHIYSKKQNHDEKALVQKICFTVMYLLKQSVRRHSAFSIPSLRKLTQSSFLAISLGVVAQSIPCQSHQQKFLPLSISHVFSLNNISAWIWNHVFGCLP